MKDARTTILMLLAVISLTVALPHATGAAPSQPVDIAYTVNFFPNDLPPLSVLARELPSGSFQAITGSLPLFSLTPIADGPDGLLYLLFGDSEEELEIATISPTSGQVVARVPYVVDPLDPPERLIPLDLTFDPHGRLLMLTGGGVINRGCFPGCIVFPRLIEIDPLTGVSLTLLRFDFSLLWIALTADEEGLLVSTTEALYRLDPESEETAMMVQYTPPFDDITLAGDLDSQGRLIVTAEANLSARRAFFSIDLATGLVDELPADPYDEPYAVAVPSTATELPIPTLGSLGLFALIGLLAMLGLRRMPARSASC